MIAAQEIPDVQYLVSETRQRLEESIAFLEHDLDEARTSIKTKELQARLRAKRRHLKFFPAIVENLPDFFGLQVQPLSFTPPKHLRKIREEFRDAVLPEAYKTVSRSHGKELQQMGLREDEVISLQDHGFLDQGRRLDLSFDHIVSLRHGGTNDFENLCLMPHFVNNAREWFERMQTCNDNTSHILTIVPKLAGSAGPYLLSVPGGFRPETQKKGVLYARARQLFHVDFRP